MIGWLFSCRTHSPLVRSFGSERDFSLSPTWNVHVHETEMWSKHSGLTSLDISLRISHTHWGGLQPLQEVGLTVDPLFTEIKRIPGGRNLTPTFLSKHVWLDRSEIFWLFVLKREAKCLVCAYLKVKPQHLLRMKYFKLKLPRLNALMPLTRSDFDADLSFRLLSCWYNSKTLPWSQWWGSESSWKETQRKKKFTFEPEGCGKRKCLQKKKRRIWGSNEQGETLETLDNMLWEHNLWTRQQKSEKSVRTARRCAVSLTPWWCWWWWWLFLYVIREKIVSIR